jgi:hypothetical protein
MHTPTAALAWELWRRHRSRLLGIIGIFFGFALIYPRLCAMGGFDPANPIAWAEYPRQFQSEAGAGPMLLRIGKAVFLLLVMIGPVTGLCASLLCVIWMFTFLEFNPNSKDPVSFPMRVFTLPVSTSFIFWRLLVGGLVVVSVLFEGWIHFVPLPYFDIFGEYLKCFAWVTLLALAQAITWGLAGWPITRFVALNVLLLGFLYSPAWGDLLESPFVLPPLFLVGAAMGYTGLRAMRRGQWQGTWGKPALLTMLSSAELRGPRQFASVARAQLWFEWPRFARTLCLFVAPGSRADGYTSGAAFCSVSSSFAGQHVVGVCDRFDFHSLHYPCPGVGIPGPEGPLFPDESAADERGNDDGLAEGLCHQHGGVVGDGFDGLMRDAVAGQCRRGGAEHLRAA